MTLDIDSEYWIIHLTPDIDSAFFLCYSKDEPEEDIRSFGKVCVLQYLLNLQFIFCCCRNSDFWLFSHNFVTDGVDKA